MDSDRVVVWMAGNKRFVVRAFLDTGAQICFATKKLAKHLAPIGNGHNFKYIKIGKKLAKIQTYEMVKGNLPVTLANQEMAVFTEYLPNVRIGYCDKETTVSLWICLVSGEDEVALSKSEMHQLGFDLVTSQGNSIWKPEGEPVANVEKKFGESYATCPKGDSDSSDGFLSEEEQSLSSQEKKKKKPELMSFSKRKQHFAKRVQVKKRYEMPGYPAA